MTTLLALFCLTFTPSAPDLPGWTVDRVVDSTWVVLETPDGSGTVDLPRALLPEAGEGDRFALTWGCPCT
jgi:hypothetical protein